MQMKRVCRKEGEVEEMGLVMEALLMRMSGVSRVLCAHSSQGRGIRNSKGNVTLVLNWCTMPIVGVIRRQHTGKAEFTFPETWEELSAATSKRRSTAN